MTKKAVHFGAGNIGRGFIGALLSENDYHVTFADVVQDLLDRINRDGKYTVHVTDTVCRDIEISDISAVNSGSDDAVKAVAQADLVTTAVGVRILRFVAPTVAKAICARKAAGNATPLNIICCENALRATSQLKELTYALLSDEDKVWAGNNVGFVDCAVDRIVPPIRCENPLDVAVEEHFEWCTQRDLFKGEIPAIKGMEVVDNLMAYLERKLFTLNTGHAITAYLGFMKGFPTILDAINNPQIYEIVRGAMQQSGAALIRKFGFRKEDHDAYIELTLRRFSNPYLHDDVTRVGRDPMRKLSANDRLVLPLTTALGMGLPVDKLLLGIGAALHFYNAEDPQSVEMISTIKAKGLAAAVSSICSIAQDNPIISQIIDSYNKVENL